MESQGPAVPEALFPGMNQAELCGTPRSEIGHIRRSLAPDSRLEAETWTSHMRGKHSSTGVHSQHSASLFPVLATGDGGSSWRFQRGGSPSSADIHLIICSSCHRCHGQSMFICYSCPHVSRSSVGKTQGQDTLDMNRLSLAGCLSSVIASLETQDI